MKVKVFEILPDEAKMIRTKVFMEEQGFQNEFDDIDDDSLHLVIFEFNEPVATCRLYYSGNRKCYVLGRLAVLKAFRGKNYGVELINKCEDEVRNRKAHRLELSAQVRVSEFYKKNGYLATDEIHVDEGCEHVWMRKEI